MSFALGGWSGDAKDVNRSKWRPSYEIVAATVKFALETKRLAEEPRKEGVEEMDSTANRTEVEEEDCDNEEDDPVG